MNEIKPAERVLFKNGSIVNFSTGAQEKADIVIVKGKIDQIGNINGADFKGEVFDVSENMIVPGLLDMHVHLREPGREDKETVKTGCLAAFAGGMTAVCPMPNTDPPADKREVIEHVIERAAKLPVDVYPIAAITKGRKGEEIAEMGDLVDAGAVAFSDDGDPVMNSAVLRRALEYTQMFNVPVIEHCQDNWLFKGGVMNEGFVSTNLGMEGIPPIAEDIMVARDILIAQFVKGHIHIAHISTAGAIELVRRAKNDGVHVTCEATPHHFTLTDEAVTSFDTNTKMNPPLRTAKDVEAVKAGLKDGTIDCIASDHAPHAIEEKDVEYAVAPFGIIGLETMVGLVFSELVDKNILTPIKALQKLSEAPRRILNIPVPEIKTGELANITIINPDAEWMVDKDIFKSKSRNTPFHGRKLKGKISAVCNKGQYWA